MKQYFFVPLLLILTGCNAPSVTASPLETFDQDRLWVLLSAVGVTDSYCSNHYRDKPILGGGYWLTDPTEYCTSFTDELATYLVHNGVSEVEAVHLRTPAFWNSLLAMSFAIDDCREKLGLWPPTHKFPRQPNRRDGETYEEFRAAEAEYHKQRSELIENHRQARRACNPYIRVLQTRDDAIKACRERLGGTEYSPPVHKRPRKPRPRDYKTHKEYQAAVREHSKQRGVSRSAHARAWRACDPYSGTRPTKQDNFEWLDIRMPPGLGLLD